MKGSGYESNLFFFLFIRRRALQSIISSLINLDSTHLLPRWTEMNAASIVMLMSPFSRLYAANLFWMKR